jgi:hypothetical protein
VRKSILSEFLNSILFSIKTRQLFYYFHLILRGIIFKSFRRNLPEPIVGLGDITPDSLDIIVDWKFINFVSYSKPDDFIVKLAGVEHEVSMCDLWSISWSDPEELLALHRFQWLLLKTSEQSDPDLGFYCILDWIKQYHASKKIGWDSYSISERTSNWVVFLQSCDTFHTDTRMIIKTSVQQQLSILLQNLELRGEATNNHIINNGRALYLAGLYFDLKEFKKAGQKILLDTLPHMFFKSGFLREGSSHYQVLLARTYLEVLVLSKRMGDLDFHRQLSPCVKNLWKAASLFLEEETMPIFGDVSPDYPIDFHKGVGLIGEDIWGEKSNAITPHKKGWHSLFTSTSVLHNNSEQPLGLVYYKDAGYVRFRNNNFSLYMYINPMGYVAPWSHGHADIGHFILYVKGEIFLIGTGRSNYTNDDISTYGRSVRSHNAVEIDFTEPMIVHGLNGFPELMPRDYYENLPNVQVFHEDGQFTVELTHYGYNRLHTKLIVTRCISIEAQQVIIEDHIEGQGAHNVSSFFHFSPETQIVNPVNTGYSLLLSSHKIDFTFSAGLNKSHRCYYNNKNHGFHFPDYGVRKSSSSIVFNQSKILPVQNRYSFKVQ